MKFNVYGVSWGSGGVDPEGILKRFVAATPLEVPLETERHARTFEVEITPEELMAMTTAHEFDILISGNGYIAFDGRGRGFRQR
jgi:hypothetical protein